MRLAIVVTHPIQYYVPVYQRLAQRVDLKVFYTATQKRYDEGFQREIRWDLPLLSSYDYVYTSPSEIVEQITNFNPKHLLVYGWAPKGHYKVLKHFKNKINILFRGDSNLLQKLPWWKELIKTRVLKRVYSFVDKAIYTGSQNKAYFEKYGLYTPLLRFAPHAVDNYRFAQSPESKVREHLGLTNQDMLVLFCGKFTANKNPLMLLNAFLAANVKNSYLLFVGGGALEKDLREQAAKHHRVHVWPFHNQQSMPGIYKACDLFCLPSRNESWGLSINEAMACQKAVLVSDQCGAAIDLVGPLNGEVFKSNQLHDLQKQLTKLLISTSTLKEAGKHSYKIIENWNFDVQVANILKCLHEK